MLCINSEVVNPYYNLALEEVLLKEKKEDVFLLWIGSPSIIVGKHQNTLGEINYHVARDKKLTIARRLSGGGTVFHDTGNLNFTWIINGESGKLVDFKKFINPIMEFLKGYGITAEYGGRNDIIVNGKKVSGNAEHVYRNRTLHHGTILFDTDLKTLRSCLKINSDKYFDKAVKSVPHPVDNLKNLTKTTDDFNDFRSKLFAFILNLDQVNSNYALTTEEKNRTEHLRDTKYTGWEWIFGYSPKYKFIKNIAIENNLEIEIEFTVNKGVIIEISVRKLKDKLLKEFLTNSLKGCLHKEDQLIQTLHANKKEYLIDTFNVEAFVFELF